jgi:hypothetical protein
MAGGEMRGVPKQDEEEAPAILLWYHGRSMVVPSCYQGTPRAARGVQASWNWLALERILRMRFRLTVKTLDAAGLMMCYGNA